MPRNPRDFPLTLAELAALTALINDIEIPDYFHEKINDSILKGMSISLLRLTQQYPYQVINTVCDIFENIAQRLQDESTAYRFSDLITLTRNLEVRDELINQHELLDYFYIQIPGLYPKMVPDLSSLVTLLEEHEQYKDFLIEPVLASIKEKDMSEYKRLIIANVPFDYSSLYKLIILYPEYIEFFLYPLSVSPRIFCDALKLNDELLPDLEFFITQNPQAEEGLFKIVLNDMSLFSYIFRSSQYFDGNEVLTFLYCFPERANDLVQILVDDPDKYDYLVTSPKILFALLDICPEKTEQLIRPIFGDAYAQYSDSIAHMKKKQPNRDVFATKKRALNSRAMIANLCNKAYGNPYHYLYNAFSSSFSIAKFSIFSMHRTSSEKLAILHQRGEKNPSGASAATLAVMNYFKRLDENVEMANASLSS